MSLIIDWGTFKALSPEHAPMAMPATTNRLNGAMLNAALHVVHPVTA